MIRARFGFPNNVRSLPEVSSMLLSKWLSIEKRLNCRPTESKLSDSLSLSKGFGWGRFRAAAFYNRDDLVRLHAGDLVNLAAWPANLEIGFLRFAQSEMHAEIVL